MSYLSEAYPSVSDDVIINSNSNDFFLNHYDLSNFYRIIQRTFAPWKEFGQMLSIQNHYHGDDRGFSLGKHVLRSSDVSNIDQTVTSRICQNIYFGVSKGLRIYEDFAVSSETEGPSNLIAPTNIEIATPNSEAYLKRGKLNIRFEGANPLIMYPLAPDIDWRSLINVKLVKIENELFLELDGFTEGKNFPAFEMFITDKNDTSVFINTIPSPTKGNIAIELMSNDYDIKREIKIKIQLINSYGFFGDSIWYGIKHFEQKYINGPALPKWIMLKTSIIEWNKQNLDKYAAPDL